MAGRLARFPKNDIMSLTGATPRYDLAESVGPDLLMRELIDLDGFSDLADLALGYRTAAGDPALRRLIAERHRVATDDVVVTMGGMHALFLLAFILCDAGDEAVTSVPLFSNARNALVAVGAEVRELPLSFDQGYGLDLAALRSLLSPKTKLVSLASPQNPSGVAWPLPVWQQVLALMGEICPDAYLLVDETYREAAYGDNPVLPTAVTLSPLVISTASLSKCHGAPGLRLGWAITQDQALRDQLILGKFSTVISCPALDEALAVRVLERQDKIVGHRREQLRQGLERTAGWVQANNAYVEWIRPDAGALCCIRLRPTMFDATAVGDFYRAASEEDVRVAPGNWFGEEARIFRLGFGLLAMTDLEAGLERLKLALQRSARMAA